jgi:hypothetical protein
MKGKLFAAIHDSPFLEIPEKCFDVFPLISLLQEQRPTPA